MKRLLPLLLNLLAVIALSASLAYWAMQLYLKKTERQLATAPASSMPEPVMGAAETLFGGGPAVVASNYQLRGVVAASVGAEGMAIISTDGRPAQAYQVGKEVAPGVTVTEVQPQYITINEGGVSKRVELAQDAKPAAQGVIQGGEKSNAPIPPQEIAPPPPPPSSSVSPTMMVPPQSQ